MLLRQSPRLRERRESALFPDKVPPAVYDNLIDAVHRYLPALYRYYELRRRKMKLPDVHHYDTYVPILSKLETRHSWQQAVKLVVDSLEPLGSEYCGALDEGLNDGWCDRYPNRGKQSGAFSSGSFDGLPYILMNYQPDVLDHVFTLAHEAGHSMHTWHSARHQPFQYYNYTLFVAEVASTFNEQLLSRHMMARARSDEERAFLINHDIDAIRGTIIRQTMFAEFEKETHALVEAGEPLTVERFKDVYRAVGPVFRPRIRDRRLPSPGVLPHPAFLSGILCLQVCHGPLGCDRAGRARHGRRRGGAGGLSRLLERRLLEIPARSLARRRRRHGTAHASRNRPSAFRTAGRRT